MKKTFTFLIFISAMCFSVFAQSRIAEFEAVRKIKMLEATRADVAKLLADIDSDNPDADYYFTDNAEFWIYYTSGKCSGGEFEERWNVPEGRVSFIKMFVRNSVKLKDANLDLTGYKKEKYVSYSDDIFIYINRNLGIALRPDHQDELSAIYLYPPRSKSNLVCNNKIGKQFTSSKRWNNDSVLWQATLAVDNNSPGNVDDVILSASEINGCKNCGNDKITITVTTEASDPENDQLIYGYDISAGKIVGTGKNVIWDLTNVPPGVYTITAKVDDGCGICGETKTKEVVVK